MSTNTRNAEKRTDIPYAGAGIKIIGVTNDEQIVTVNDATGIALGIDADGHLESVVDLEGAHMDRFIQFVENDVGFVHQWQAPLTVYLTEAFDR